MEITTIQIQPRLIMSTVLRSVKQAIMKSTILQSLDLTKKWIQVFIASCQP